MIAGQMCIAPMRKSTFSLALDKGEGGEEDSPHSFFTGNDAAAKRNPANPVKTKRREILLPKPGCFDISLCQP